MKIDTVHNKSCQRMDELPDESVDIVMSSPPYWGLRNYGDDVAEQWDGWQGQLGLEPTFQLYLDHMMIVCAEIKRVLKKTGSFWLNMGDTYSATRWSSIPSTTGKSRPCSDIVLKKQILLPSKCLIGIPWRLVLRLIDEQGWILRNAIIWAKPNSMPSSVKDRCSNGYEFLFHFVKNIEPQYCWNEKTGLMVDRKPKVLKKGVDWDWQEVGMVDENTFNVRVRDADTVRFLQGATEEEKANYGKSKLKKKSHWRSLGYWYDLDAIREPHKESSLQRIQIGREENRPLQTEEHIKGVGYKLGYKKLKLESKGKNPGDVWTIPTQPRPEAHFATFPDALCIRPILATCPAEICRRCGKARVRIIEKPDMSKRPKRSSVAKTFEDKHLGFKERSAGQKYQEWRNKNPDITIGWTDCGCNAGFEPGIVLDPFAGRGTALIMAKKLGRHYVGYELKKEYCEKLIEPALEEIDPLFRKEL